MPTAVRHSRRARTDLLQIWLEIAEHNPTAADHLFDRLEARVEILSRFVEAGVARPDIAKEARMLVEGPYLILYRIRSNDVQIVRVLHGARTIGRAEFADGLE